MDKRDGYKLGRKEYRRQHRLTHRGQLNQYARNYYKKYSKEHPEKYREWTNRYRAKARYEAINHYSESKMCCGCCSEKTYEFLGLDHIEGGGSKHRKSFSGSIYVWLKARGFPEGYRVLCHNCNLALGFYGYCPHQVREEDYANIIKEGNALLH